MVARGFAWDAAGVITYASRRHYAAHIAPIVRALGDRPASPAILVASHRDLLAARGVHPGVPRILAQHGIGQSYGKPYPPYPGGNDNDDVGLFLAPNDHAADRWRARYPAARVEVVGSPILDDLPRRPRTDEAPVLAVSWHWDARHTPEARSAFPWWRQAVADLAREYRVLGHAHPLARDRSAWYRSVGIEPVETFDEVCRRADLYLVDNSSTLYEFAATGRPVVVLDAPWYRRDVSHGLRFWDAADVGVRVAFPDALGDAVALALADPEPVAAARARALDLVYRYRTDGAAYAADAIVDFLRDHERTRAA